MLELAGIAAIVVYTADPVHDGIARFSPHLLLRHGPVRADGEDDGYVVLAQAGGEQRFQYGRGHQVRGRGSADVVDYDCRALGVARNVGKGRPIRRFGQRACDGCRKVLNR